jgi:hypothetical protein
MTGSDTQVPVSERPAPPPGSQRRRAALIASGIAVPITVLLAFLLTAKSSTAPNPNAPLPAVTVVPPPAPSALVNADCLKVFEKLPVQLGSLSPRKTDSDSAFVAAWGNPAIVIRCGVGAPDPSGQPDPQFVTDAANTDGVLWQPELDKTKTVYTTIDRAVNIEITVPANADQPLPLLAQAVNALPAICTGTDSAGNSTPGLPVCKDAG